MTCRQSQIGDLDRNALVGRPDSRGHPVAEGPSTHDSAARGAGGCIVGDRNGAKDATAKRPPVDTKWDDTMYRVRSRHTEYCLTGPGTGEGGGKDEAGRGRSWMIVGGDLGLGGRSVGFDEPETRGAVFIQFQDKSLSRLAFIPPSTFFSFITQIIIVFLKVFSFLLKFIKLLFINLTCNSCLFSKKKGMV